MTATERAISAAWRRLLALPSVPQSKIIHQQLPTSETWVAQHATWRPAGYYRLFCAHDRPLWEPCGAATCRRGSREARLNMQKLVSGELR